MKKIDWYIIKKYLGTFFFTTILAIMVVVVVNASENVDDFIEYSVPFKSIVFEYYFNFVPNIILMVCPLFVFIAVIFFTSQMASRTELVAILGSGVSYYRVLLGPYLLSAVFLMGLQLYANHFLVPKANLGMLEYEDKYTKNKLNKRERNINMQLDEQSYLTLKSYEPKDSVGREFILEVVEDKKLIKKIKASQIKWLNEKQKWQLKNYTIREINGEDEKLMTGDTIISEFPLSPDDFGQKEMFKNALTTPDLDKLIERERVKGSSNLAALQVERYKRTALPFATIILTIIGFAIASRKTRGGMGLHLLMGLGISGLFVVMLQFATSFAIKSNFSPLLAVWLPNIFFSVISLILVRLSPK